LLAQRVIAMTICQVSGIAGWMIAWISAGMHSAQ